MILTNHGYNSWQGISKALEGEENTALFYKSQSPIPLWRVSAAALCFNQKPISNFVSCQVVRICLYGSLFSRYN